ncbi:hypothetical protein ES705_46611 [subsurface metagenome]
MIFSSGKRIVIFSIDLSNEIIPIVIETPIIISSQIDLDRLSSPKKLSMKRFIVPNNSIVVEDLKTNFCFLSAIILNKGAMKSNERLIDKTIS